jgi:hypothetical protein
MEVGVPEQAADQIADQMPDAVGHATAPRCGGSARDDGDCGGLSQLKIHMRLCKSGFAVAAK